jgi:putative membrane protein
MSWLEAFRFIKALHIIFVVTWFAGLFYLPRLFVYHAEATEPVVRERLKVMERKLMIMTHIGGALAVAFGIAMLIMDPGYLRFPWMHVKLTLVALLIAYHFGLLHLKNRFARDACDWSSKRLRWFNEVPSLLLVAIVFLVVVKPF